LLKWMFIGIYLMTSFNSK